jgi:hypothetical protein
MMQLTADAEGDFDQGQFGEWFTPLLVIAALRARGRRATRSLDPISQRRSILPTGGSIVSIDPDQCRPTIPSNY